MKRFSWLKCVLRSILRISREKLTRAIFALKESLYFVGMFFVAIAFFAAIAAIYNYSDLLARFFPFRVLWFVGVGLLIPVVLVIGCLIVNDVFFGE